MIYDFRCENSNCSKYVELDIKLKDYESGNYDHTCPECQSNLRRVINVPKFRLVGPNWARDGYHSEIDAEERHEKETFDQNQKIAEENWDFDVKQGLA